MYNLSKIALIGAAVAIAAPFASATPIVITQGQTVVTGAVDTAPPMSTPTPGPGATSGPTNPTPIGAYVFQTGYVLYNAPTFTAGFSESVLHDANNIFCSGCLTFAFQFNNAAGSKNAIEHFTAGSFGSYATAVGYDNGSGTANQSPTASTTDAEPVTVDESLDSTISFNFDSLAFAPAVGIQPGNTSDIFYVDTNAMTVTPGFGALIDSTSVNVNIDVPAPPVTATPEPSSLVMLGTGLLGAAGMIVRRRKIA